jgi:hypothetical protein
MTIKKGVHAFLSDFRKRAIPEAQEQDLVGVV